MKIYKKKKSHKELGRFTQNRYIRIADILSMWNDMRIVDITKLYAMPCLKLKNVSHQWVA